MRAVIGAVLAVLLAAPALAQKPEPIRVHIFTATDASGLVDAAQKERQRAVKALNSLIPARVNLWDKAQGIRIVPRDQAQITQEVVEQRLDRKTAGDVALEGVAAARDLRVMVLRLRYGTYSTDFVCKGNDRPEADRSCDRQSSTWLKDNRDEMKSPEGK